MSDQYKWRVRFENRTYHVIAATMEEAEALAGDGEDGELQTIELYNPGEEYPWGMCYVSPNARTGDFNHE